MKNALKFNPEDVDAITDPTTGSGDIRLFDEALGQEGQPFVLHVQDPPNKTRPRHYHHGDVIYFYVAGEHHIEGEGTYRAGDVRWTRAGHAYGPETTGSEGATHIAPGSWQWDRHRQPKTEELARVVMSAGDVVLFRADLVHGGGADESKARRRETGGGMLGLYEGGDPANALKTGDKT